MIRKLTSYFSSKKENLNSLILSEDIKSIREYLKNNGKIEIKDILNSTTLESSEIFEELISFFPPDERITDNCYKFRSLKIVKKLLENDYPISKNAAMFILKEGQPEILKYLIDLNLIRFSFSWIFRHQGLIEILSKAFDEKKENDQKMLMTLTFSSLNTDILRHLSHFL